MCGKGIHGKYTGITVPLLFVVQSLSHVRPSATPWIAAPQAIYPSLSPRVCSHSCPLSWYCYLTISSSAAPFPFCLHSFPASGSLPVSRFFISGGQILELQLQHQSFQWIVSRFPLGINWFDLLEIQGLSRFFSSNTVQKHQFFGAQPFLWSISHICTWLLEKLLLLLFSQSCVTLCNPMLCSTPWN